MGKGRLTKAQRNRLEGYRKLNRQKGFFDPKLRPLSGKERKIALSKARICGFPLGSNLKALSCLDVFFRKRIPFKQNKSLQKWSPNELEKQGYETLPKNRACIVLEKTSYNVFCIYVPCTADPCVEHELRFFKMAFLIASKVKPKLAKRGFDFEGSMYMFGHRFDTYSNAFKEYAYNADTLDEEMGVLASHFSGMQSLERRHIPALSDERAHLVENVNAPTLVGENVVATTGSITKGYGCLPHKDKLSLLVESIAFHNPPLHRLKWKFALPCAKVMVDLGGAPGMLYVPAKEYHATLPCGEDHIGLGSAIFTKSLLVGRRARCEFSNK